MPKEIDCLAIGRSIEKIRIRYSNIRTPAKLYKKEKRLFPELLKICKQLMEQA